MLKTDEFPTARYLGSAKLHVEVLCELVDEATEDILCTIYYVNIMSRLDICHVPSSKSMFSIMGGDNDYLLIVSYLYSDTTSTNSIEPTGHMHCDPRQQYRGA